MATLHGLAGRHCKSKATRQTEYIILWSAIFVGGFCFIGGFTVAQSGSRHAWLSMVAAAAAIAILWSIFRRYLEPHLDSVSRRRISYLRGGQMEALVAWLLMDLGKEWHLFNGMQLEKSSDIDHILVGPGGLFCISTKAARGWFVATPQGLLHNNKPCDFADQVLRQTMNLKDRLQAIMGSDIPWIHAVLAVPLGFVDGDACSGKVIVVNQESIVERIAPETAPQRLDKRQLDRIVASLEMLEKDAARLYKRP